MALITPHRRAPRLGALVGSSVSGVLLTAAGLGIAYAVLETPLVSVLSTDRLSETGRMPIGLGILSLSLIAGGALLLAGTNRLAVALARVRAGHANAGPGARALATDGRCGRRDRTCRAEPMVVPSPSSPSDRSG